MKHWSGKWLLFSIICCAFSLTYVAVSMGSSTNSPQTAENESHKLKVHGSSNGGSVEGEETFNLDDYRPIDPVPISKNAIRPGPIQHEVPLMPFIPQPCPPPSQGDQYVSP